MIVSCIKGNVKSFICFIYAFISFLLFLVTHNIFIGRCGYPCAHVLTVTNEITIDMIKVQHWKIYATHYDDESLGIGMELKNAISLPAK